MDLLTGPVDGEVCALRPNALRILIQPREGIRLSFLVKQPGPGNIMRSALLGFDYHDLVDAPPTAPAYQRLLLDALVGRLAPFIQGLQAAKRLHRRLIDRILRATMTWIDTTPSGRILYTPHAVLAHDYLQGWAHLLRKAKMVAAADERIDGTDDPNVQAMLERLHALQLADGRARWQRIVGAAVQRTFRAVVGYYRWRGR